MPRRSRKPAAADPLPTPAATNPPEHPPVVPPAGDAGTGDAAAAAGCDQPDPPGADAGWTENSSVAAGRPPVDAAGHPAVGRDRNRFGVYRDADQGIRVDRERERAAGLPFTRVLVSFRDKALADERAALKAEGFRFDDRVEAWGKEATAANVLLAKQLVNRFLKERGVGSQLYV